MNSQHLMQMPTPELSRRVEPLLREAGLWRDEYAGPRAGWLCQVLELFKPRARRLPEFVERGRLFFGDVTSYDEAAQRKLWASPDTHAWLTQLAAALESLAAFDVADVERAVRGFAEERGIKAPALMQAVRLAVSGSSASPGLFEMLSLLGRETTVARLRRAAASPAVGPFHVGPFTRLYPSLCSVRLQPDHPPDHRRTRPRLRLETQLCREPCDASRRRAESRDGLRALATMAVRGRRDGVCGHGV